MRNHSIRDALMPRTAQHQTESELRSASVNRPSPVAFVSGNQQQKDAERAELSRLMAEFKRRGGKVQIIDHTPVQRLKSRRQASAEGAARRIGKIPRLPTDE